MIKERAPILILSTTRLLLQKGETMGSFQDAAKPNPVRHYGPKGGSAQ